MKKIDLLDNFRIDNIDEFDEKLKEVLEKIEEFNNNGYVSINFDTEGDLNIRLSLANCIVGRLLELGYDAVISGIYLKVDWRC